MANTVKSAVDSKARIAQLEATIEARKNEEKKTGSQERKLRIVKLVAHMSELCDTSKLTEEELATLQSLMTEYVAPQKVVCNLGDSILQLFEKFGHVKNLRKKLEDICTENGWKMDWSVGKIVKA